MTRGELPMWWTDLGHLVEYRIARFVRERDVDNLAKISN